MSIPPPLNVNVSAPGKLMLLGEHAVVHQRPCLVTAVDARLHMRLMRTDDQPATLTIDAPDVAVHRAQRPLSEVFAGGQALAHGTRFIESAVAVFRERYGLSSSLHIATHSDFSSQYGLGSSSATVAATLLGLSHLGGIALRPRELFDLGWQAIYQVQTTGSGFDLAAAIYGGTLYYNNIEPREIVPLAVDHLPLLAAYTGTKADTPTYVRRVQARRAAWPEAMTLIFDAMAQIVADGRGALEQRDWSRLGQLMDMQHGLAHALGVDTAETAALVFAARAAGAYGAKLSGAGGGDSIIVLCPDEQRASLAAALQMAGGQLLDVATNAPGVRLDAAH